MNTVELNSVIKKMMVDLDRVYGDLETKYQQEALRSAMIRLEKLYAEVNKEEVTQ